MTSLGTFLEARQAAQQGILKLLRSPHLSFIEEAFVEDMDHTPQEFPWVLVTLVGRQRLQHEQSSDPREETWLVRFNCMVVCGQGVDSRYLTTQKNEWVDTVQNVFDNERAFGQFLSTPFVADCWTDATDYRDVQLKNAAGAPGVDADTYDPRLLLQAGEFTLYVILHFRRKELTA